MCEVLCECGLLFNVFVLYFVCFVLFLYLLIEYWECVYIGVGMLFYDLFGGYEGFLCYWYFIRCGVLWFVLVFKLDLFVGVI